MQVIKFRAWDIKRKVMHTVWRLDFSDEGDEPFSHEDIQVHYKNMWITLERDEYILEQFARSIEDGKDIYAGDIIKEEVARTPHTVYLNKEVSFENGMFLLGKSPLGWSSPECLEIIGNIHENPDLLKV